MSRTVSLWTIVLLGAGLGVGLAGSVPEIVVATFSDMRPGGLPSGWRPWDFPSVERKTDYALSEEDGRVALRATSASSASAVVREVTVDPAQHPYLSWSWKTEPGCVIGHWQDAERDDFPLRLFVLFEERRGLLSFFRSRFSGLDGKALLYLTHDGPDERDRRTSHVSDRIRVVPLRVADGSAPGWTALTRNVHDDYLHLFGDTPRRVKGVALMTDTDDTATACVSYFGDIVFSSTGQGGPLVD